MATNEISKKDASAALAGVDNARSAVADRVATPRWWDAAIALSIGAYLAAVAYLEGRWVAVAVVGWLAVFLGLQLYRRRTRGVAADGSTHRTLSLDLVWVWLALAALYVGALALGRETPWIPIAGIVLVTVFAYVGFRWANARAVARTRGDTA